MQQLITEAKERLTAALDNNLPAGAWRSIELHNNSWGCGYKIAFAASEVDINRVAGQKPQIVSLYLDLEDMSLKVQSFGGNGGQCLYRKPDKTNPKESYLAMCRIRVPFRTPKKDKFSVLKAVERFAQRWTQLLEENVEQLCYHDLVDYNSLLSKN